MPRNLVSSHKRPDPHADANAREHDAAEDFAPASLYDGPDDATDGAPVEHDGDGADSVFDDRDDATGGAGGAAPGRAPGFWRAAVADCALPLAEAAAGLARLDERLRVMTPPERMATRERLATLQACRLMWGEGVMVAPEAVALDALDRRGRAGHDAPAVTVARRLTLRLARDLGGGAPQTRRLSSEIDADGPASSHEEPSDSDALDAALDAALRGAPPLVAAALAVARVDPPTEAARVDAAATRLIAAARGRRDGAVFAPVPARRRPAGLTPEARLAAFLGDVADGARDALALLDDLAAWRARANAAATIMKGATPARMIALLAARPALSAPAAASALRLSDDAALRVLARLERDGFVRELTGHGRFRVWSARL